MKKILFRLTISTVIIFGSYSCKLPGISILTQSLEETLSKGIVQHLNEMNHEPETNRFISLIGNTNDKVEFKESGEVYLQLFRSNQVFNITQLQQQRRLCGLKNFMQRSK